MRRLPGWIFFIYLCWLLFALAAPVVAENFPKPVMIPPSNCPQVQVAYGVEGRSLLTYTKIRDACNNGVWHKYRGKLKRWEK